MTTPPTLESIFLAAIDIDSAQEIVGFAATIWLAQTPRPT
jgi:hypothetical protein